jgi:hypothetical protein
VQRQQREFRTYEGYDHVGIVLNPKSPLIPDSIQWTKDRFVENASPPACVARKQ